jgi:hypothetical protein
VSLGLLENLDWELTAGKTSICDGSQNLPAGGCHRGGCSLRHLTPETGPVGCSLLGKTGPLPKSKNAKAAGLVPEVVK